MEKFPFVALKPQEFELILVEVVERPNGTKVNTPMGNCKAKRWLSAKTPILKSLVEVIAIKE